MLACMSVINTSGVYATAIARLLFAVADMVALSLSAGASECTSCPDNSNSPVGSTSAGSCVCNAGYIGSNGSTCTACEAGKFKMFPGVSVSHFMFVHSDQKSLCTLMSQYTKATTHLLFAVADMGALSLSAGTSECIQ